MYVDVTKGPGKELSIDSRVSGSRVFIPIQMKTDGRTSQRLTRRVNQSTLEGRQMRVVERK